MFWEMIVLTPGSGTIAIGGIKLINKNILNLPDVVKIGLMALITVVVIKWALNTMGMTTYAKDI
jgi:hypothetical protein